MGQFSWMYADNPERALPVGGTAFVVSPDGHVFWEGGYDGYGHFDGFDIYELVAFWNREFLSNLPDLTLRNGKKVSNFPWYKFYADIEGVAWEDLSDVVRENTKSDDFIYPFELRSIGIDIACWDEDNERLLHPIRIFSKIPTGSIESFPASKSDPNQGWGSLSNDSTSHIIGTIQSYNDGSISFDSLELPEDVEKQVMDLISPYCEASSRGMPEEIAEDISEIIVI